MIISYGRSVYDTWALGDANGVTSIGSISPNMAIPGGPGFTLTVNGEGFVAGAAVRWNGTPLVTTFVSANQLTAAVPASLTARQGTARIVAMNPGDAPSGPVPFTIRAPLGPVRR